MSGNDLMIAVCLFGAATNAAYAGWYWGKGRHAASGFWAAISLWCLLSGQHYLWVKP